MKNFSKREALILFILLFLFVSGIKAQTPKSAAESVEAGVNRSFEIKMRSNELERMKQEADRDLADKREPVKSFPEIKEDFEQIQAVNFNSVQNNVVKTLPDYKTLGKAATEIKKRAYRLKKSLFPQELSKSGVVTDKVSNPTVQPDLSKAELKPLSIALDNSIYRFVSNNLFQNTKVVNLDDSVKAQNELNRIIEICSLIEIKSKNDSK